MKKIDKSKIKAGCKYAAVYPNGSITAFEVKPAPNSRGVIISDYTRYGWRISGISLDRQIARADSVYQLTENEYDKIKAKLDAYRVWFDKMFAKIDPEMSSGNNTRESCIR